MARSCENYANAIKRTAGWVFAHMLYHYFGQCKIILEGEGPDGNDLEFAATLKWLELNHVNNFGLFEDDVEEVNGHINSCNNPQCIAARKRLDMITLYFQKGALPGPDALTVMSVFRKSNSLSSEFRISKGKFGDDIDDLKKFILWFTEDKDFWVTP